MRGRGVFEPRLSPIQSPAARVARFWLGSPKAAVDAAEAECRLYEALATVPELPTPVTGSFGVNTGVAADRFHFAKESTLDALP
jgi:hypothetical protein